MPSGRSGGSRMGSSRGGSFSRSGSSRGSFSGRSSHSSGPSRSSSMGGHHHHHHGRRGGTFIFFGGRRYSYGQGRAMGFMGVLAIISLFAAVIGLFMMLGANSTIKLLQTDYAVYPAMASAGQSGQYKTVEAKELTAMMNDKGGKWYIEYELATTDSSGTLYGTSFPIYTQSEAIAIENGLKSNYLIVIKSTTLTITQDTDSVPLDHKDATIEIDGDYIDAKSTKSTGSMMLYGGGILFVVLLLLEAGVFATLKKGGADNDMDMNTTSTTSPMQNSQPQQQQQQQSSTTKCIYCGTRMGVGDTKCPGCGSKK